MAGTSVKKRSFNDGPKGRAQRPTKKQKKAAEYHSSSEDSASDDEGGPVPSHLLDSDDEDLENVEVDDGASTADSESDSGSDSLSEPEPAPKRKKQERFVAKDAPSSEDDDGSDSGSGSDFGSDSDSDAASHSDASSARRQQQQQQQQQRGAGKGAGGSKRNDPSAFATSMSKMLSSKVPASRRADPIVARSAAAAERARQAADSALEAKARRRLREQKRLAMEKGRVRDVLVASRTRTLDLATGEIVEVPDEAARPGEPRTTAEILAAERRLRKTAQRGVVKLFNAVRAAQVKAAEAERAARREGLVGVKRKEEKVAEMSRKGFLDLIASGGGGLKKGGLEEA
ncbi:hypothetical protein VTH06DRAFT_6850 [Thermothelomyces fergusii]